MGSESVGRVTKDSLGFSCLGSYASEDGRPNFEYAVHKCYGPIVGGVVGVSFVWFVDKFGSVVAPFFGSVVVFSHEAEKVVDKVLGLFW